MVLLVKSRVKGMVAAAATFRGKALAGLLLWAVMVGSKLVVLEAVALLFGGQVRLASSR